MPDWTTNVQSQRTVVSNQLTRNYECVYDKPVKTKEQLCCSDLICIKRNSLNEWSVSVRRRLLGWLKRFYLQTQQTWPLAWFSSEKSAMGLQWDAITTLCSVDRFLVFSRKVKMAMVSEFLGQLSLNIGVMSYLFSFIHYVQKLHSKRFKKPWVCFCLTLISFDSSELWAQIPDCGSRFGLWPRQRCSQNRDCYQD